MGSKSRECRRQARQESGEALAGREFIAPKPADIIVHAVSATALTGFALHDSFTRADGFEQTIFGQGLSLRAIGPAHEHTRVGLFGMFVVEGLEVGAAGLLFGRREPLEWFRWVRPLEG